MSEVEILPDPIKIIELPPDEPEPELTEEEQELKRKKEKAQKCKVIALYKMGHHPIKANVSHFNHKSKLQVLNLVRELFEKPDEEIQTEFNEICCEVVFVENNDGDDYTSFPIYKSSAIRPKPPVVDCGGNIIS
jgi:hypothetical protein